ncbi:MAG: ABC transporter substrate-binding protein [Candidatus ainarchaeum sp.]|nr:ABC transporter substrate-binding protein [Candidatus ainarchaeum sp.]
MKTKILFLVGMIAVAFLLAGCAQPQGETVKIGFAGPMSGAMAYTGEAVKNGFELAHSQKSTFKGKQIEIIYEDEKCNPAEALSAAKKLVEIDDSNIVVSGVCSSSTLAIAPYAQEKKIILISPVAATPALTNAGEYVFRIASSSVHMASNAARIAKESGYEKVAVLFEVNDYTVAWKDVFKREFEKLGGEIVAEDGFNSADKELKTQFLKIKETNPDLILTTTLSAPTAIMVLKQAKELGVNTRMLGNETFSFKSVISADTEAAEGMLITTYAYDLNSAEMQKFLSDYKQKYNKDVTEEIYSALGYDTYNLLYDAISSCNGNNAECIKAYLSNQKEHTGASGTYHLDANGDAIRQVVLRKVENGKLVLVK